MSDIFGGEGFGKETEKALNEKFTQKIGEERVEVFEEFINKYDYAEDLLCELGEGESFRPYVLKKHPNIENYSYVEVVYTGAIEMEDLLHECGYDTSKTKRKVADFLLEDF